MDRVHRATSNPRPPARDTDSSPASTADASSPYPKKPSTSLLGRLGVTFVAALTALATSVALAPPPASGATTTTVNDPAYAPYDLAVDAPVLIVLGQSNAVGWSTSITDSADLAQCNSFAHVKGLKTAQNRVVGALNATWTPYTCAGSNLGSDRTTSYNAYNTATVTALRWERAIQAGASLPDLNVIHVAWGSQGVQRFDWPSDRWWPDRNPSDVESLYQFTLNTISNGLRALQEAGKRPRIIGMHWNQWEAEASQKTTVSTSRVQQAFLNVLEPLRTVTGAGTSTPIFLYRPRTTNYDETETQHVTEALTGLANRPAPNPYTLIDPALATTATGTPLYDPSVVKNYGIFNGDGVHYTRAVHEWFADQQWKSVFTNGRYGAPVAKQVNVAIGRPATQSSTIAPAAKAVDGNTNGVYAVGSVTHTDLDANAWWQTDLGASTPINTIKINSRNDGTDGYRGRSANASVFVSATDMTGRSYADLHSDPTVWRYDIPGTPPAQMTIPVATQGRYVRVQLPGTNYLSLAEVSVYTLRN
ncbi:discoidin domain-containing protein [Kitasatospora sp. NPDC058406]|uniref:galactose-binding domain-containing protein n=1 Tax=Kitasatospora sp. NPDC058406 TaxID=3346483 RepID=UPI0036556312